MGRDYPADTRAPGPEESSCVDLFHLCFGCGVQIERVQGKFRGQSAPTPRLRCSGQRDRDARAQGRVQRVVTILDLAVLPQKSRKIPACSTPSEILVAWQIARSWLYD